MRPTKQAAPFPRCRDLIPRSPVRVCMCVYRKQDNDSVSVRTLCHHPKQPLENIVLANYSSRECVMSRQPSEEGLLFVCGCGEEPECNDKLIFEKSPNGNGGPPQQFTVKCYSCYTAYFPF